MLRRRAVSLAIAALALAAPRAEAIVFQDATAQSNGVGMGTPYLDGEAGLIVSLNNATAVICSGSLLAGGDYVLTAAHCVTGSDDTLAATGISVTFANISLTVGAASYVVDPTWDGVIDNGGDLAVIKLSTPVTSITGYTIDTTDDAVGQVVTLAGYGDTGYGAAGYTNNSFGTLRFGQNSYDGTFTAAPSIYGFDFDKFGDPSSNLFGGNAVGPNEVMIGPGDSGGGSLVEIAGIWNIVGVHDFIGCFTYQCTPNSSFGQYGGDTSVQANAGFILEAVPEPASVPVLAAALALAGAVRWRARAAHRV